VVGESGERVESDPDLGELVVAHGVAVDRDRAEQIRSKADWRASVERVFE